MKKTLKKKAAKKKPNRCRLVLIKRDTSMRCYMEWQPESAGDKLLAKADTVEHETQHKFFACVQYEKPVGEDGKTLPEPRPPAVPDQQRTAPAGSKQEAAVTRHSLCTTWAAIRLSHRLPFWLATRRNQMRTSRSFCQMLLMAM
jgi:hypothetical protein